MLGLDNGDIQDLTRPLGRKKAPVVAEFIAHVGYPAGRGALAGARAIAGASVSIAERTLCPASRRRNASGPQRRPGCVNRMRYANDV
jgi:hypothetical protein